MDIYITNKTNKSWEAVYVIEKVRQLFSKHRVSNGGGVTERSTNRSLFLYLKKKKIFNHYLIL